MAPMDLRGPASDAKPESSSVSFAGARRVRHEQNGRLRADPNNNEMAFLMKISGTLREPPPRADRSVWSCGEEVRANEPLPLLNSTAAPLSVETAEASPTPGVQ